MRLLLSYLINQNLDTRPEGQAEVSMLAGRFRGLSRHAVACGILPLVLLALLLAAPPASAQECGSCDTARVQLSVSRGSVTEDGGPQTVKVTARLTQLVGWLTGVKVNIRNGTAKKGSDLETVREFSIQIGNSLVPAWEGSRTFTLTPVDDSVHEDDETVRVTGTAKVQAFNFSGEGYREWTLPVDGTTITIEDDDPLPTGITLTPDPASVNETGDPQEVQVTAALVGGHRCSGDVRGRNGGGRG